jgi:shikimate dehydrogenase
MGLDDYRYENFDIADIAELRGIIANNPDIRGLNVTIPYKESVIPLLDKISKKAAAIGAVNTIHITRKGELKGYNSDYFGFKKSVQPLLQLQHKNALILGTGGAAKAVAYALDELGINYTFVSREAAENSITYDEINQTTFENYQIVINCTPLGTSPDVLSFPDIPYEYFTASHIAFDLIYNPQETVFLERAKSHGATTKNGYEMLVLQAEKSWSIWTL